MHFNDIYALCACERAWNRCKKGWIWRCIKIIIHLLLHCTLYNMHVPANLSYFLSIFFHNVSSSRKSLPKYNKRAPFIFQIHVQFNAVVIICKTCRQRQFQLRPHTTIISLIIMSELPKHCIVKSSSSFSESRIRKWIRLVDVIVLYDIHNIQGYGIRTDCSIQAECVPQTISQHLCNETI